MVFRQIRTFFPFSRLLKFLIGLAITAQIIVITYNHLSGYYVLDGFQHFLLRLTRGTILSLIAGFLITYPDLFVIRYLNNIAPWNKKILKRVSIQLVFTIIIAIIISTFITLMANCISPYTEEFTGVLVNNALIYSVANVIVVAILEGWIFYNESRQAKQMAKNLQEELSQIKFEVLKSQINPHFMFNSLNVLSGLINKDIIKAQQFIDEFSQIYRYVLETIEQPVTTLGKELDFMHSYLTLQQIRYGEMLTYTVNLPAHLLPLVLPPLSLQVVLENAIKHNIVNETKPLKIEISHQGSSLIVKNNLQPKISSGVSTGLGLRNLVKRYALIGKLEPEFYVENNFYIAKLPLIDPDCDECSDR